MSDRRPQKGDKIRANWLNELAGKVEQFSKLKVAAPLILNNGASGPSIGLVSSASAGGSFYAQLMSVSGAAYGWREVVLSGASWLPVPGGRTGTPTSRPAFEFNFANDLPVGVNGGAIVQLLPGRKHLDYYFTFNRMGVPEHPPLPCKGQVCVGAVFCPGTFQQTGAAPGTVTVTVTDSNGNGVASGSVGANGLFCFQPPAAGTYTVTGTTSCTNFQSSATATLKYACQPTGVTLYFPVDDTAWPSSSYVSNACCGCCPPCTGQPPYKIPKTLYLTFNGPFGIFGNYAGVPIAVTLQPDSNLASCDGDNPQFPPSGFLHWSTGCIGGSGSWGSCYYYGFCGRFDIVNGELICEEAQSPIKQVPGSKLLYNSLQVDLYQDLGSCSTSVSFNNYFSSGCSDFNNLPSCGEFLNYFYLGGYPTCPKPCPCSISGIDDNAVPYIGCTYPKSVSLPFSYPDLGLAAGSFDSLCAPVNQTISGIRVFNPVDGCLPAKCDGTPEYWSVTVTE